MKIYFFPFVIFVRDCKSLLQYLRNESSFILLEVINDLLLFTHPTVEQMEQFYYLFLLRIRGGSRNKCISDIALANR